MVRHWPALDIPDADDLVLVALDEWAPTAIEEREPGIRVFFATREERDAARASLIGRHPASVALDVSDEDWAVRSQQNLTPIVVGRIRVVPDLRFLNPSPPFRIARSNAAPSAAHSALPGTPHIDLPDALEIVVEPSMGFGTGHHATTRLCLMALQSIDLNGSTVLDVGTGSGILAIAAARLGAATVRGIDCDGDAIQSATENLAHNPDARHVTFELADLSVARLPQADLVVANLTGAVLIRSAARLLSAAHGDGTLVLSGILASEAADVRAAFSSATLRDQRQEDEWVCLTFGRI